MEYARRIVFADRDGAEKAIDSMAAIHAAVEDRRGRPIPAGAYRDVLFMLIAYSIRAFELLERPLTDAEKQEITDVFGRVGQRMGIPEVPLDYATWQLMRDDHLTQHMQLSHYTADLFQQYRKHLGGLRYSLLRQVQGLLVPPLVRELLQLPSGTALRPALTLYGHTKNWPPSQWAKNALLPNKYRARIQALDMPLQPESLMKRCPFSGRTTAHSQAVKALAR